MRMTPSFSVPARGRFATRRRCLTEFGGAAIPRQTVAQAEKQDMADVNVKELVLAIQELHVRREQAIRMQIRIGNACGAYARRLLGWRMDLPEKERTAIAKQAAKVVGKG